jgi:acyl-CoA thioester hydrolase
MTAFDYPSPFIMDWSVAHQDLDSYQHANNVRYVAKLEELAWAHSGELGLSVREYEQHDRGMAIVRHEIDYLGAAYLNDTISCATWLINCDAKLRVSRAFQFVRQADQKTLLRAKTDFVCIQLSTGNIKRMPKHYADIYTAACIAG